MRQLLIFLIQCYRALLSPFLGRNCRFHPTCSEYAITAIEHHGAVKGTALAIARLGKCHPWHEGGFDPVPQTQHKHH
jgi:putative membrane protein insertion efficiency factor